MIKYVIKYVKFINFIKAVFFYVNLSYSLLEDVFIILIFVSLHKYVNKNDYGRCMK